jgi:fatty acid desaturase
MTAPKNTALRAPKVAGPTLLLALGVVVFWVSAAILEAMDLVSPILSFLISTLAAYAAFTVAHDAAHRSVARAPWINEGVGRLSAWILTGPFPALKEAHLAHHRDVNDPDKDPDHYSASQHAWQLPLRWWTQDLYYYVWFFRRWNKIKVAVRVETLATLVCLIAVIGFGVSQGWTRELLLYWLLPARLAIGMLSFAFDWLPQHPHSILGRQDRFRATHITEGPLFNVLFLFQNLHQVHHMYPGIPFYRYQRVWEAKRAEWVAKGVRVQRFGYAGSQPLSQE